MGRGKRHRNHGGAGTHTKRRRRRRSSSPVDRRVCAGDFITYVPGILSAGPERERTWQKETIVSELAFFLTYLLLTYNFRHERAMKFPATMNRRGEEAERKQRMARGCSFAPLISVSYYTTRTMWAPRSENQQFKTSDYH